MKKYSQSNNLPSTELKKPKIDHKMLNKEGQRHRAARHRAVGLLSRGVAVILVFVIALFAFNLLSFSVYGRSSTHVVLERGGYDESDVILESYRFNSGSAAFDAVEDGFGILSGFSSFISSTVRSVSNFIFGSVSFSPFLPDDDVWLFILEDGDDVYFYVSPATRIFWGYSFVVGITKLPCGLSNIDMSISYAIVHVERFLASQKLVLYSASSKELAEYHIRYYNLMKYSDVISYLYSEFGFVIE